MREFTSLGAQTYYYFSLHWAIGYVTAILCYSGCSENLSLSTQPSELSVSEIEFIKSTPAAVSLPSKKTTSLRESLLKRITFRPHTVCYPDYLYYMPYDM